MPEKHTHEPFSASWKWVAPILVGLLLIGGGIVLCFFLNRLEKLNDSHAGVIMAYCFALMVVLTGIVLIVLRLLKLFADNLEKERLVIAELYVDTQRRQIAENGKNIQEEITRLKKELEEERRRIPEEKCSDALKIVDEENAGLKKRISTLEKSLDEEKKKNESLADKVKFLEEINKRLCYKM